MAAPFVHPRLAAVDVRSEGTLTINDITEKTLSHNEWAAQYITAN